jgi:hypothetical protein
MCNKYNKKHGNVCHHCNKPQVKRRSTGAIVARGQKKCYTNGCYTGLDISFPFKTCEECRKKFSEQEKLRNAEHHKVQFRKSIV